MQIFSYTAVQRSGVRTQGEIRAASKAEVFRILDRQGMQPLSVKAVGGESPSEAASNGSGKSTPSAAPKTSSAKAPLRKGDQPLKNPLSQSQLVTFTDELSDLLEAGLQLEPALRIMEQRKEFSQLKPVIAELRNKVREGISFSSALRTTSSSFDELYCNLVTAGEVSGTLHQILRRQATYLASVNELQNRVIQSLLYPAFITAAGIGLVIFFTVFLVPQLEKMLSQTGGSLPLVTRILIDFSKLLTTYWYVIVGAFVAFLIVFFAHTSTPVGRRWWDEAKLKLPLFGMVLSTRFYAQFAQTLATLVGNGVPLLNALRLVNSGNKNTYLHECIKKVTDAVAEGGSFSRALLRFAKFPPVFIDMVVVGEQTGDLAASLQKIAARYDRELDRRIARMTALIQPAIVVGLALFVGLIAYSMISGIFEISSGMRR